MEAPEPSGEFPMNEPGTSTTHPQVRYAQCWEDADILLQAFAPLSGKVCLSIASAGDNSLALLAGNPERVVAIDSNPAQIACLELRIAAYRELEHEALLELLGSSPSSRRLSLYSRCRKLLSLGAQKFWDAHEPAIRDGIGTAGKFERYLAMFRGRILPLIHNHRRIERLLAGGTAEAREQFYSSEWDTWRWRLLFRVFFSRFFMSRLGRDPGCFKFVQGSIGDHVLARTRHAFTALDPRANPYLEWILTGRHAVEQPCALRARNFALIRQNLDRLEWHTCSLEEFLQSNQGQKIDRFNLSDIFEYMSLEEYLRLLRALVQASNPGARFAYWNLLAPRVRPESLANSIRPVQDIAARLFAADKAWFYSSFILEEVVP